MQSQKNGLWPELVTLDLAPTLETLHLWTQVVGKVRLMLTPWENHGWHVSFYVSPRGLTTGLIPVPGRAFTIEFDFLSGLLVIRVADGNEARLPLTASSLATFHCEVMDLVRTLGIEVAIRPMPTEIADAVRFDRDERSRIFDLDVAREYWRALLEVHRVFQLFRTRFVGKVSPIHLFWGAFDLAVTRFSGRAAPAHPGGAPFMNDAIAREAYSREVSSAGFWPNLGDPRGPCFYSYAFPAPRGFDEAVVRPETACFDARLGEFVLSYADVRASADPDGCLLAFLQTTYVAAADLATWDRSSLECDQGSIGAPPKGS